MKHDTSEMNEDEYMAYLMTLLLGYVNPKLNVALAYPVVLDLVHDGLGEDNVEQYGRQLGKLLTTSKTDVRH